LLLARFCRFFHVSILSVVSQRGSELQNPGAEFELFPQHMCDIFQPGKSQKSSHAQNRPAGVLSRSFWPMHCSISLIACSPSQSHAKREELRKRSYATSKRNIGFRHAFSGGSAPEGSPATMIGRTQAFASSRTTQHKVRWIHTNTDGSRKIN